MICSPVATRLSPSPARRALLLACALALSAGAARADHSPSPAAQALANAAAPGLTRSALRATNPALDDPAFNLKWKAALASPLLFIRSFPAGYHSSLKGAPPPPGAEALCVGDAHPANGCRLG